MTEWTPWLVTLLALAACGPADPHAPPVPETCLEQTWYADADGDGFGDLATAVDDCMAPARHVAVAGDCDDADPLRHPGVREDCAFPEVDEDCDGLVGDDDALGAAGAVVAWPDADGDGHGDEAAGPSDYCTVPPDAAFHADDCDDGDPDTWIGAAYRENPGGCTTDADGDGWASDDPTSAAAEPGTDCDDTEPSAYLHAVEVLADGIDQDCDEVDATGLFDGFELGFPSLGVWESVDAGFVVQGIAQATGAFGIKSPYGGGWATTRAIDTTACSEVWWMYEGSHDPIRGSVGLSVEYWDGSVWVEADVWDGLGWSEILVFDRRFGVLTDAAVFHPEFKVRVGRQIGDSFFYVDDFFVGCPGTDSDGDGQPTDLDCDETSAAHWADCGSCVDSDGDGHGPGCDLGGDCHPGDPGIHPAAADPSGDGIDSNCDGYDGEILLFDDFETGGMDPSKWSWSSADYVGLAYSGMVSLDLHQSSSVATHPIDTTDCTNGVAWSFMGRRGPVAPIAGYGLTVWYWGGSMNLTEHDVWYGDGTVDPDWSLRSGVITDPAAQAPWFELHLSYTSAWQTDGDYFIDDVQVTCAP